MERSDTRVCSVRNAFASEAAKGRMCTRPPSARTASTPSNVGCKAAGATESVLMLILSS